MKRFQELNTLVFIIYNVINNTCHRYTDCNICELRGDENCNCNYHSRIENNRQMQRLFSKYFDLNNCCDSNCNTCKIDHLCSDDATCGFSIIADHVIKLNKRDT